MRAEAAVAALAVGVFSAAMMAPAAVSLSSAAALAGLLAWSLARRSPSVAHVALFGLLWAATSALFPASRTWPTKILVPLAVYALVVAPAPALRRSLDWLRSGRILWGWIVLTAAVSDLALTAWVELAHPDLSVHLSKIPDAPRWTYPLVALAFATGNAAVEELVFRGIVMGSLDRTLGENAGSVVLQAVCFGAAHFVEGFPNGWLGFAMATVYGVMLGFIRRRSGGLLTPWLAHVAADLTIFALLVL